ncbi:MAG: dTDP-glucose 4,6-dehydratase [Chlamydiia bacterium]|nr:dTDP-glucose 4,6-dehydratase [Chlamydiia bacterium]
MRDHLLVSGGAGFLGSAFIRYTLQHRPCTIVNLDNLTYAANEPHIDHPNYTFIKGDICDRPLLDQILEQHPIDTLVHFAAESHVDRSISDAAPFINSNIVGTYHLLEAVRQYPDIHFHHISTDEVYGSTTPEAPFHPHSPYRPNSPYAASKAASDHLVRAFAKTYNLKTTLSHSCNNYGPYQHQEKFIPTIISHARQKKPIPIYGQGLNKRTWIHVDDHAEALWHILDKGQSGETYPIGTSDLISNLDLVHTLLPLIDPNAPITFVADRPGHDLAYVLDTTKTTTELNWQPKIPLTVGLEHTVNWYLNAVPV